jgi:hypothetical protein
VDNFKEFKRGEEDGYASLDNKENDYVGLKVYHFVVSWSFELDGHKTC